MASGRGAEEARPSGGSSDMTAACDLRAFTRIGCLGDSTGIRRFLFELAAARTEDAAVAVVPGALEEHFLDDPGPLPDLARALERPRELVSPAATSLIVVALARHEHRLEALRQALAPDVVVRALFLDNPTDVEALVVLGRRGERSLFVRPSAASSLHPHLDSGGILFDAPRARPEVGLAVLGPVTLTGIDYPLERHPKLTELVTYLALHPEGATSRTWTGALWPDRKMPGQTVANRLSEARRIVGFASDGRPRLRREGERHLLVEFGSDWQALQEFASSEDPAQWRSGLALVRGRPFEDLGHAEWLYFEGHLAEVERTVADLGVRLARNALAEDDPGLCAWASQQAIRANPFDERAHRLLMLASDAFGNRAGVEEALRQLALVLEIDGDPLLGVHPETARLYQRLTSREATPNRR